MRLIAFVATFCVTLWLVAVHPVHGSSQLDQWVFGTKQLYQPLLRSFPHFHSTPDPLTQCKPGKVIQVSRHGARFPTPRKVSRVLRSLETLCSSSFSSVSSDFLCSSLPTLIEEYGAGVLTEAGKEEMKRHGEEFFHTFVQPHLPSDDPDWLSFLPSTSTSHRTFQSCVAFVQGLNRAYSSWLGEEGSKVLVEESRCEGVSDDLLLRFHKDHIHNLFCPLYGQAKELVEPVLDINELLVGEEDASFYEDFYFAFQLLNSLNLTQSDLDSLSTQTFYDSLFDTVWAGKRELLHHLSVMEAVENHKTRYEDALVRVEGEGGEEKELFLPSSSFLLFKHIATLLGQQTNGQGVDSHHFFAHDSTLMPLLSLLDLFSFSEQPVIGEVSSPHRYEVPLANASSITPYASMLTLVQCDSKEEKHRQVLLRYNGLWFVEDGDSMDFSARFGADRVAELERKFEQTCPLFEESEAGKVCESGSESVRD